MRYVLPLTTIHGGGVDSTPRLDGEPVEAKFLGVLILTPTIGAIAILGATLITNTLDAGGQPN
jgi:hypothetical protein